MNFDYNEEQQLLADSVRRFLQKDYDFEARRKILASPEGWSARVWSQLAQMGLTGLPFSPDYGGFGGGAVDLMGVMEAFGEALVVEPYLATIMGAQLVARAGSAEQKRVILPAVIEGRMKLAFAHTERKEGEKLGVVGAPIADKLVVSSGSRLFLADRADVKMKPYRTMDNMVAADLVFSKDRAEPMPGADQAIEETVDFATALVCAEAVGAMKFACDATLEYLKTRKQFGVPIGSFQALQHRMVDMVISYEQARSMACLACARVDSAANAAERSRAVSAAKIKIADSARHIGQEAVQLHGGMGIDRKSTRLNSSHGYISYAVFCLKKKKYNETTNRDHTTLQL